MDVESIMQHYLRDCILGLVEFQNCWKSKLVTLYPFGPNSTSPTAYKCMKVPKCKNNNKSQCTYRTYFTADIARSRWRLNQIWCNNIYKKAYRKPNTKQDGKYKNTQIAGHISRPIYAGKVICRWRLNQYNAAAHGCTIISTFSLPFPSHKSWPKSQNPY